MKRPNQAGVPRAPARARLRPSTPVSKLSAKRNIGAEKLFIFRLVLKIGEDETVAVQQIAGRNKEAENDTRTTFASNRLESGPAQGRSGRRNRTVLCCYRSVRGRSNERIDVKFASQGCAVGVSADEFEPVEGVDLPIAS